MTKTLQSLYRLILTGAFLAAAFNLSAQTAEALFQQGHKKMLANDLDGAIKLYDQAIAKDANHVNAWINRGIAKANKGNDLRSVELHAEAVKDFDKAIQLAPDQSLLYRRRAMSRALTSDFNGALQDYNKYVELAPKDPEAYFSKAKFESDVMQDDATAIKTYSKAIELRPDYAEAWNNRGLVFLLLKDWESACADLQQAARLGLARGKENYDKFCITEPDFIKQHREQQQQGGGQH